MSQLVFYAELCPANEKLQAFVAWWKVNGPFPIKLLYGNRTDNEQTKLYAQGRWLPGRIVTHARRARDSAHGHGAAIDAVPVRKLLANGRVELVYLGDEADLALRTEARRRFNIMADVAEQQFALESGRGFPGLHDYPHLQDPAWETLPLIEGVAP